MRIIKTGIGSGNTHDLCSWLLKVPWLGVLVANEDSRKNFLDTLMKLAKDIVNENKCDHNNVVVSREKFNQFLRCFDSIYKSATQRVAVNPEEFNGKGVTDVVIEREGDYNEIAARRIEKELDQMRIEL